MRFERLFSIFPHLIPLWCFFFLVGSVAFADVKMPAIFGDHMVLQQEHDLPVWGTADPGEQITVSLGDHTASAVTGSDGRWLVRLAPLPARNTPLEMIVRGSNVLQFRDVLIGEVWLCSGQSNMGMALSRSERGTQAVDASANSLMRIFRVEKAIALEPESDCVGRWEICGPESVRSFSAVSYYFGRDIQARIGQPVGLIGSYRGGTPAQAWVSRQTLAASPVLAPYLDRLSVAGSLPPALTNYFDVLLPAWKKALARNKEAGGTLPPAPIIADEAARQPTLLYNAMIHPLIPYGIRGVIWYQGEANAHTTEEASRYDVLFPALIESWRHEWGDRNFPFLFVQLAGFNAPRQDWPRLRESQRRALAVPNTSMASAIDLGEADDIHPRNKAEVGRRLALIARRAVYAEKDLIATGPMFASFQVEGSKIRLRFDDIGAGLAIQMPSPASGSLDMLTAFEVAGSDGNFVQAMARIEGDTVVAWSPAVTQPVAARYAWTPMATGNLVNKDGLPASPFTTRKNP